MKYFKQLTSTGDTIIEVLVVLAILGLALSISYATANHGLNQSRNAEEHSEALGIINRQVEDLRSVYANKTDSTIPNDRSFCFPAGSTSVQPFPAVFKVSQTDKISDVGKYGNCGNQNTLYNVSVTARNIGTQAFYDFLVRWDGIGNLGPQQEELSYRIGQLSVASGIPEASGPPTPPVPSPLASAHYNGADFLGASCIDEGNYPIDPVHNGCQTNGTAMFAWRRVKFSYAPITNLKTGPARLIISYNQYNWLTQPNTYPPLGYAFSLHITAGTILDTTVSMSVPPGPSSYSPLQFSIPVTIPGTGSGTLPLLSLDWLNDSYVSKNADPNLQINSIDFVSP